jgi:spermidine synthase
MAASSPLKSIKRWLTRMPSVEVSEAHGVRSLHLGGDAIQSSIRLNNPDKLELHYTRAMMAALLFVPAPKDVLMVGLGGGSIARFFHRHFPATHMTAVEINPKVVSVARQYFGLPEDDERLKVVVADGAEYVPAHPASADMFLHDAFEDGETIAALCTQKFFDACAAALRTNGVFVMNFMADEPKFDQYSERIAKAFDDRMAILPSADRVNRVVFAMKTPLTRLPLEALKRDAVRLEKKLGLPLIASLKDLVKFNPHTTAYLRLTV